MSMLMIRMIRYYQNHMSPSKPARCRFIPTCSQYAIEAIEIHGPVKGLGKAIWRVLRCNPFGGSGYDPVDKKKNVR